MGFTRVNDISVHFELKRGGAGATTIVFINSLGTDFRIWSELVAELRGAFHVLLYDKRGHGLSGKGDAAARIETYASDLETLLGQLDLDDVVLCGLSIGGLIAQSVHARRPGLVRKLMLCDTAARIGSEETWAARISAVRANGIDSLADDVMRKWFSPAFHRDRPNALCGYREMLVRQLPEGYVMACETLRTADLRSLAPKIAVPTLVVCGDQDGSTPPSLVESFARSIPGATYRLISGAAHIPCVEQPRHLAALLHDFVK